MSSLDFQPYDYRPQYAGAAAPFAQSDEKKAEPVAQRVGAVTVISACLSFNDLLYFDTNNPAAFGDDADISGTPDADIGGQRTYVHFLGFFGDTTPQKLFLSWARDSPPIADTAMNIRVQQGNGEIVFPNTRFTRAVSTQIDRVDPVRRIDSGQSLWLVMPVFAKDSGVPGFGERGFWNSRPNRLLVSLHMLTSQVA